MNLKIAAAVAAVMGCSAPAFALDLATTIDVQNQTGAVVPVAQTVVVNVAGASAQRDAFLAFMAKSICQTGSLDMYRASPTGGTDFRAYSCRIANNAVYGAASNKFAVVFYRAEGGSAWGPVPMSRRNASAPFYTAANDIAITRLNVDGTCLNTTPATVNGVSYTIHDCPVTAGDYQITTDTSSSGDTNFATRTVDLGVADVEPKMFSGVNFPTISSRLTVIPAGSRDGFLAQLNNLAVVGFGQTFGVIVNTNQAGTPFATAAKRTVGKNVIAGIFNGTFTNWNQIVGADGNLISSSSLPIKVCRREQGSGTQVAAHQYFLGAPVCNPQFPNGSFVLGNGTSVIEATTTGDLTTCVQGNAGAIGIAVGNAAPTNTAFLAINGQTPSRNAAAIGAYDYWYEQTFTVNPRLGAGATLDLANALIAEARLAASAPNADSVISLPNENNDPLSQGAFVTTQPPISFGSRGGDSCAPIAPLAP